MKRSSASVDLVLSHSRRNFILFSSGKGYTFGSFILYIDILPLPICMFLQVEHNFSPDFVFNGFSSYINSFTNEIVTRSL